MTNRILIGDCREQLATLPEKSVHCCVTSPPYWALRSYLDADHPDKCYELGCEPTPEEYVATWWTCSARSGAS
jgi:DNA modification methylase